jgi:hypothetical protein
MISGVGGVGRIGERRGDSLRHAEEVVGRPTEAAAGRGAGPSGFPPLDSAARRVRRAGRLDADLDAEHAARAYVAAVHAEMLRGSAWRLLAAWTRRRTGRARRCALWGPTTTAPMDQGADPMPTPRTPRGATHP